MIAKHNRSSRYFVFLLAIACDSQPRLFPLLAGHIGADRGGYGWMWADRAPWYPPPGGQPAGSRGRRPSRHAWAAQPGAGQASYTIQPAQHSPCPQPRFLCFLCVLDVFLVFPMFPRCVSCVSFSYVSYVSYLSYGSYVSYVSCVSYVCLPCFISLFPMFPMHVSYVSYVSYVCFLCFLCVLFHLCPTPTPNPHHRPHQCSLSGEMGNQ